MEDTDIIDLYLVRDEGAIKETATKYGRLLRQIAYSILNCEESAEECENDTYLRTWNLIPPNEPRDYFLAFLGKLTRHLAIDEYRKNHTIKRFARTVELSQEMEECIPAGKTEEGWERVEEEALLGAINSFLETRPEWQRKVFVRRYWFCDSITEISKRYGYSEGKVKTELCRMRTKLKAWLEKEGYEV